jgi:hypothetical protein
MLPFHRCQPKFTRRLKHNYHRQHTCAMAPGRGKLQLGESWVVEGESESPEHSPKDDDYRPPTTRATPPRRQTRGSTRSPEPELIMPSPSLELDSLNGSWAEASRNTKFIGTRSSGKAPEARRRSVRVSNGSPEKRVRTKVNTTSSSGNAPQSTYQEDSNGIQDILDVAINHITIMLSWLLDVFGGALKVLKTPLSYFLAIWLLFGLLVVVRNFVTTSIYASLSPVCRIPGVSLLNLPFCPVYNVDTSHGPPPSVEFDQLMVVQSKFEEVLEESAGSVSLPLDMKRGEASIRDLRQLVRYSQLHSK